MLHASAICLHVIASSLYNFHTTSFVFWLIGGRPVGFLFLISTLFHSFLSSWPYHNTLFFKNQALLALFLSLSEKLLIYEYFREKIILFPCFSLTFGTFPHQPSLYGGRRSISPPLLPLLLPLCFVSPPFKKPISFYENPLRSIIIPLQSIIILSVTL